MKMSIGDVLVQSAAGRDNQIDQRDMMHPGSNLRRRDWHVSGVYLEFRGTRLFPDGIEQKEAAQLLIACVAN